MIKIALVVLLGGLGGCVSPEAPTAETSQTEASGAPILQETSPRQGVESTYDCEPLSDAEVKVARPRQLEAGVAIPIERKGLGKPKPYTTYRCPEGPK